GPGCSLSTRERFPPGGGGPARLSRRPIPRTLVPFSRGGSRMTRVSINGKLFDKADARVSVYDHWLLYGDGVFEGIRIYNGKVFRLREHIDRLYESAKHIFLEIPWSRERMTEEVLKTVQANEKKEGYIRLVVTRGAGSLGLDPNRCSDPQIIV